MNEMPFSAQLCGGQATPDDLDRYEAEGKWVAEPKYDGILCMAEVGISKPRFWSRNAKEKAYDLPAFPVDCILYGELAFGQQASKKAIEAAGHGLMWVFDMLRLNREDLSMLSTQDRRARLELLWPKIGRLSEYYVLAEQRRSGFHAWYNEIVDAGGEGLILKLQPGSPYQGGVRIDEHVKCKKELTVDAVLMGVEVSTSAAWKGIAKSLIIGQYDAAGVLVEIGRAGGLAADERRRFWQYREKLVAAQTVIEVKCNEIFRSGSLRHPSYIRVRDDKLASECRLGGSR